MKYCTKCGNRINEDAYICPSCGCLVDLSKANKPAKVLRTDRSFLKYILLSIITFGIYGIYLMTTVSSDINTIASRYDGKNTMNYCLYWFVIDTITFGVAYYVWNHRIASRINDELYRRGIDYSFGIGTFWGWDVLARITIVGPCIYTRKMFKAMNLLSNDYNIRG